MHSTRRSISRGTLIALAAGLLWALAFHAPGAADQASAPRGGALALVSAGPSGPGNGDSSQGVPSADGGLVLFTSFASNLVLSDTNDAPDIFLRDMAGDSVQRLSQQSGGLQANDASAGPAMTPDARFITFYSFASNLVPSDTNGFSDIFLVYRAGDSTITLTRVTTGTQGTQPNGDSFNPDISDDALRVVFDSAATNLTAADDGAWNDIFLYRRDTGTTRRLSLSNNNTPGNGHSSRPRISADGKVVVYYSEADNLVYGDTNGAGDLFRVDLESFDVERVSVAPDGAPADQGALPEFELSADGRYIVFASASTNLVDGDTNGVQDIFLYDATTRSTGLISRSNTGELADGPSFDPTISADGRWIGFRTAATTLVAGDTNGVTEGVIVNRGTRIVLPIAEGPNGEPPDGEIFSPHFSADGSVVTFTAAASNLLPGDTNEKSDVYRAAASSLVPGPLFLPLGVLNLLPSPCLREDLEPNNASAEAGANLPLCQNVTVNGTLLEGDANDYYRVTLSSPAYVAIDLFNIAPGSDFDLYLYNSGLSELASSRNNGNASEQITGLLLDSGTYYIRVYPDPTEPGGARTYQLRWRR